MTMYNQFRGSSLDLSILGLIEGPAVSSDPLTPAQARVLGWLPNSPVHFCQVPDQGETVFAVDPQALPGEQILPVAEDIPTFIGLLICCKDAALIAGAYQWSSIRFRELVDGVVPGMKARSVIRALQNIYHPPVIDDPGAAMSRLRMASMSKCEQKVGFGSDFSESCPKGRAGKELCVNRSIDHESGSWHIPSVFLCDEGIVVDTYLEVSGERLAVFREHWEHRAEHSLSLADQLQRHLDDPLSADICSILTVNDKPITCKHSFSAIWNPFQDNQAKVRSILNHYGLDLDQGYLFKRYCFLRKGKQPQVRTMQLTLEALPVLVPDESFTVSKDGTRFRFTHPGTGLEHSFTAVSLTHEALNPNFLTNHPCFYSRLTYTLEPSISSDNFRVVDQVPSDYWEGYREEPAAVIYQDRKPDPGRYALSSLHFEPQSQVRWQMIFRRKLHQDLLVKLLP